jgi:hypothetical protein
MMVLLARILDDLRSREGNVVDEWPHKEIVDDLCGIMGKQGPTKQPRDRMRTAIQLHSTLVRRLGLESGDTSPAEQGKLIEAILRAAVKRYGGSTYPDRAKVVAAGELLGFKIVSDDVIRTYLQPRPEWLDDDDIDVWRASRSFRLFVALVADGRPELTRRAAQNRQSQVWAPTMVDALKNYLDEHLAEAQQIAVRLHYKLYRGRIQASNSSLAPHVADALDAAQALCVAIDRKFVTAHVLFALLELPDSKAAKCFKQTSDRLVDEWTREFEYVRAPAPAGLYPAFKESSSWENRPEVRRAEQLAKEAEEEETGELHVLLGVLNTNSRTNRRLTEMLGPYGFDELRKNVITMLEETPGPAGDVEQ